MIVTELPVHSRTADEWVAKYRDLEKVLPTLPVPEESHRLLNVELHAAHQILNKRISGMPFASQQDNELQLRLSKIAALMKEGAQIQGVHETSERERAEFGWSMAEVAMTVGVGIALTAVTGAAGAAITGALVAQGLSYGTAALFGTQCAAIFGAALGAGLKAGQAVNEDYVFDRRFQSDRFIEKVAMGAAEGAMAALVPSAWRGLAKSPEVQAMTKVATRHGISLRGNVVDGALSGFALEGTRSYLKQSYSEKREFVNWLEVAQSALTGAAVGGGLGALFPLAAKGASKISGKVTSIIGGFRKPSPIPVPIQPAPNPLAEITEYRPDLSQARVVHGGIRIVPPEGVRAIPEALKSDLDFVAAHGGDLHKRLEHHQLLEVLHRLGIKLTSARNTDELRNLNPAEAGYAQKVQALLTDLDDSTIRKTLRFFGVNCDTDAAWDQQVKWARAGWKGLPHISDCDDTIKDGWIIHPIDLQVLPPIIAPFKIAGTILHYTTRLNVGGINYIFQQRPLAYEIFNVLKTGKTLAIRTDGFKWLLGKMYDAFPTKRFVDTFKLPYQVVHYADDVLNNPRIVSIEAHVAAVEKKIAGPLREGNHWDGFSAELKDVMSMILFHKKGYKLKTQPLYPDVEGPLVDNASYNTIDGFARLGGNAVRIVDRNMTVLSWWATGDPLMRVHMMGRALGVKWMESAANFFGRLNRLPQARYASWDDVAPFIESVQGVKGRVVDFNDPKPVDLLTKAIRIFHRPFERKGLIEGSEVQRGTVYISWDTMSNEFEANIGRSKRLLKEIRERLSGETFEDGKTALDLAEQNFKRLMNLDVRPANRFAKTAEEKASGV